MLVILHYEEAHVCVVFFPDRASKLRAPCTKCTALYSEKITANKADSSCRAAERVPNRTRIEPNRMSYQERRQCLDTDHEVRSAQNKSTRGVE